MANEKKAEHGTSFPETCTKADLSMLLGISMRALGDLVSTGVLVPGAKRGTYQTQASIKNYVEKLRLAASNRADDQRNPLNDEKMLTEKVVRQIRELDLAERKGEVLSLDEVMENWTAFARKVKSSYLALPTKLRQKLPHLTPADGDIIRKVVRRALQSLAKEVEASVIAADPGDVKDK